MEQLPGTIKGAVVFPNLKSIVFVDIRVNKWSTFLAQNFEGQCAPLI